MTAPARGPALRRELVVCGGSDTGAQRASNQDRFAIVDLASGVASRPCVKTDVSVARPGVLLLVCDGMGGPPAGDVAARVAATSIEEELRAAGDAVVAEPGPTLARAVEGANRAILDEASTHPEEKGMGTTCTAVVFSPEALSVAHVGDSRAYLFRDGRLWPLTRDQTVAAHLAEVGAISLSAVERSPYRHVLEQALGTERRVAPDITDHELHEHDRILVCSDGLYGPVGDREIAKILAGAPGPWDATNALIQAALAAGGPDNVTAVVADCGPLVDASAG